MRGSDNLGIEDRCYYSKVIDTWTDDVRNETLPSDILEYEIAEDRKISKHKDGSL